FSTTDSAILGTVSENEEYQILYRENDWVQILFDSRVAWIHSNYIEVTTGTITQPVQAADQFDNKKRVRVGANPTNVRTQPSTDAEILTTVREVTDFEVKSEVDDWYEIEVADGQIGYVANWVTE